MGEIKAHPPVKFLTAITFSNEEILPVIFSELENLFSGIDFRSEIILFDSYTDYYEKEMGKNLYKQFISFKRLESPDLLALKKQDTNVLEQDYLDETGKRQVNIDPGYLTLSNLILATTKNYSHRIWLGGGIYADLHLMYHHHSFEPMPWTYPDYKANTDIFNEIRRIYHDQVKDKHSFGD